MEHQDPSKPLNFQSFLRNELAKRIERNPAYSARAFAKQVGVNSGTFSQILSGKRKLTPKMLTKLGAALGLEFEELKSFEKELDTTDLSYLNQLSWDHFRTMSDWYHDAIIELMATDDFQQDFDFISQKLGISVTEAQRAVDRLIRLGLLEVDKQGHWKNRVGATNISVSHDLTTSALKKYQGQILSNSLDALQNVPIEKRHHASMTIAMPSSLVEKVKTEIRESRARIFKMINEEKKQPADAVYCLQTSFFPVSQFLENES